MFTVQILPNELKNGDEPVKDLRRTVENSLNEVLEGVRNGTIEADIETEFASVAWWDNPTEI